MSTLRQATQKALDALITKPAAPMVSHLNVLLQSIREAQAILTTALSQPDDKAQPVAWQPLETAPEGVRVLLGPRNAPVVGVVKHMPDWADEQDPIAHVVHYNGKTLVSNYRCSEWMPLPDAAPQPPAGQALPTQLDVTLDEDEAKLLRDTIGTDEDAMAIRLLVGDGHSGHGLYVASADYPEEGALLLHAIQKPPAEQGAELSDELRSAISDLAFEELGSPSDWCGLPATFYSRLARLMAADRAARGEKK